VFKDGEPIGEVVEVNAKIELPRITRSGTMRVKAVDSEWEQTLWRWFTGLKPVWE